MGVSRFVFWAFTGVAAHFQDLFRCGDGDSFLSTLCAQLSLPSRQSAWCNVVRPPGVGYRVKCISEVSEVVHGAVSKYYVTRVVTAAEKEGIKKRQQKMSQLVGPELLHEVLTVCGVKKGGLLAQRALAS